MVVNTSFDCERFRFDFCVSACLSLEYASGRVYPIAQKGGKERVKGSQSRLEMFEKLRLPGFLEFTATLRE
jgi:hypothetical protein